MHFVLATIGTRGDVQPLVALGVGLVGAGHRVTVATHVDFEPLVTSHGLGFRSVEPSTRSLVDTELGRRWMASGANIVRYSRLTRQIFGRAWQSWTADFDRALEDADVVVHYPMAFGALISAERRGIPAMVAAPWPAFPSSDFAHPMVSPASLPWPRLNRLTHAVADAFFSRPLLDDYLALRRRLGAPPPRAKGFFRHLWSLGLPTVHLFSPAVFPRATDWPEQVEVTGYTFLDRLADWEPPAELVRFIDGGPPPLAIGFGSMMSHEPARLAGAVDEALRRTGQRAVLVGGWSGSELLIDPSRAHLVDDVPHDWLFPRCSAVVHHGGAGTTGASLRAGKPTVVVSFFGDQPFWGRRVHALGAGPRPLPSTKVTGSLLTARIAEAIGNPRMQESAAAIGRTIAAEDGVSQAVRAIERHVV